MVIATLCYNYVIRGRGARGLGVLMTNLVEKYRQLFLKAIDDDSLVLPTMPEMALRVREVADDPNASIKQLAAIIGQDAALAARIIKVANSAIYRGAKVIEDLQYGPLAIGHEHNLCFGDWPCHGADVSSH